MFYFNDNYSPAETDTIKLTNIFNFGIHDKPSMEKEVSVGAFNVSTFIIHNIVLLLYLYLCHTSASPP